MVYMFTDDEGKTGTCRAVRWLPNMHEYTDHIADQIFPR